MKLTQALISIVISRFFPFYTEQSCMIGGDQSWHSACLAGLPAVGQRQSLRLDALSVPRALFGRRFPHPSIDMHLRYLGTIIEI